MNSPHFPPGRPASQQRLPGAALVFAQQLQGRFASPGIPFNARLAAVLHDACTLFDMRCGLVTLAQGEQINPVASVGFGCLAAPRTRAALTQTYTRRLLAESTAIVFGGAGQVPVGDLQDYAGTRPQRFIGVPLMFDGQVIGTVELSAGYCGNPISDIELSAAYFMAAAFAPPLALMVG